MSGNAVDYGYRSWNTRYTVADVVDKAVNVFFNKLFAIFLNI